MSKWGVEARRQSKVGQQGSWRMGQWDNETVGSVEMGYESSQLLYGMGEPGANGRMIMGQWAAGQ